MKKLITLLFISTFVYSCQPEPSNNVPAHELEGTWTMTAYQAFMIPPIPTFNDGDNVWNFQFDQQNLNVENNVHNQYPYLFESNDYLLEDLGGNIIEIDGTQYAYQIDGQELSIERYYAPHITPEGDTLHVVIADNPVKKFIRY